MSHERLSRTGLLALLLFAFPAGGIAASPPMSEQRSAPPPRLAPCPSSPNCVSSQAADEAHRVAPIPFAGSPEGAVERLRAVVLKQPRTRIVASSPLSFRAEFRSALFRFVDDVDVVADPALSVLEIRSASRVGYSDLGVNRKRVERLRESFARPGTSDEVGLSRP